MTDSTAPHRVVVVGNGLAGARLQDEVLRRDPAGERVRVVVYGDEPHPAYNRILLSTVVAGRLRPEDIGLRPSSWADDHADRTHLGVSVTGIDRARRTITRSDGRTDTYDTLVLATGSSAALPPVPGLRDDDGQPAPGVVTFRTLEDCAVIAASAGPGSRVVVVGAGLLGVEAARGAAMRGAQVTVVHPKTHPMEKQLDRAGGAVLARVLRELGVDIALGARAAAVRHVDGALQVDLTDGTCVDADLVVVTAGARPNTDLAVACGLTVGRAVVVDDRLRTSDPHIRAIGDCAEHRGEVYGLVQPAWEMAAVLADDLCGVDGSAYEGSAVVTRLKAHGIDLASMGCVETPDDDETEVLTLSDPTRGRYAKVLVRKDRLIGAVMLGNPEVVGTLGQYFDAGTPVPSDRMTLLLGHLAGGPAETSSPSTMPDAAVVCRCNTVTKKHLVAAWRRGCHTTTAMAQATRATTGCGSCVSAVDGLCEWLHRADPPTADPPTADPPTADPPTADPPTADPLAPASSPDPRPTSLVRSST